MCNEPEKLILQSILVCSYCDSKNTKILGSTTTLAGIGPDAEWNFHNKYDWQHTHDHNYVYNLCECLDCHKKFSVQQLQSCICGWTQKVRVDSDHENYVRTLAHDNWVRDGRPNGEEYRDHPKWGRMKIKDIHWRRAVDRAEANMHHGPGGDWG